jgi:alkylated DNA repair protein (DNA oxidative demethylase)
VITAASTVVGRLEPDVQRLLVADLGEIRRAAPMFTPVAGGLDMSVQITNAGPVGWCATSGDRKRFPFAEREGYHYAARHPVTGEPWPAIPPRWLELADMFRGPDEDGPLLPWDCAHIVYYRPPKGSDPGANLGWHRDKTEADRRGRVITFPLGDDAWWEIEDEDGNKTSTILRSGDVVRLSGPTRHLQHRIAKVLPRQTLDLFAPTESPLSGPGRVVISARSGARRAV